MPAPAQRQFEHRLAVRNRAHPSFRSCDCASLVCFFSLFSVSPSDHNVCSDPLRHSTNQLLSWDGSKLIDLLLVATMKEDKSIKTVEFRVVVEREKLIFFHASNGLESIPVGITDEKTKQTAWLPPFELDEKFIVGLGAPRELLPVILSEPNSPSSLPDEFFSMDATFKPKCLCRNPECDLHFSATPVDNRTMLRCGHCGALYCSANCQKASWPLHKLVCCKPVDFPSRVLSSFADTLNFYAQLIFGGMKMQTSGWVDMSQLVNNIKKTGHKGGVMEITRSGCVQVFGIPLLLDALNKQQQQQPKPDKDAYFFNLGLVLRLRKFLRLCSTFTLSRAMDAKLASSEGGWMGNVSIQPGSRVMFQSDIKLRNSVETDVNQGQLAVYLVNISPATENANKLKPVSTNNQNEFAQSLAEEYKSKSNEPDKHSFCLIVQGRRVHMVQCYSGIYNYADWLNAEKKDILLSNHHALLPKNFQASYQFDPSKISQWRAPISSTDAVQKLEDSLLLLTKPGTQLKERQSAYQSITGVIDPNLASTPYHNVFFLRTIIH